MLSLVAIIIVMLIGLDENVTRYYIFYGNVAFQWISMNVHDLVFKKNSEVLVDKINFIL